MQMRKKSKVFIMLLLAVIVTFVGSTVIYSLGTSFHPNAALRQYAAIIKAEEEELEKIRTEMKAVFESWQRGDVDRDGMAARALPLVAELARLSHDYEELGSSFASLASNKTSESLSIYFRGLLLKTEVMLYDMTKGYASPDNPYATMERMADERLRYVYEPRNAAYDRDVDYLMKLLGNIL